jgi:hypothetical protein
MKPLFLATALNLVSHTGDNASPKDQKEKEMQHRMVPIFREIGQQQNRKSIMQIYHDRTYAELGSRRSALKPNFEPCRERISTQTNQARCEEGSLVDISWSQRVAF